MTEGVLDKYLKNPVISTVYQAEGLPVTLYTR